MNKVISSLSLEKPALMRWGKLMTTFALGQGGVQLIQLLSGFFLIRWLSLEEYAQYSVAFAFQSTAQMLVEFGFSGAIIALVGDRVHDKKVLGNYIKAGRFYRNRFFWIVGLGCIVLFPLMTAKHQWSWSVTVLLLVCILSNLYFSGNISYYSSPLKIHQKLSTLYSIQIKHGAVRFILITVLHAVAILNAWLAALSTSLLTIANGLTFRKKANAYVEEPQAAEPLVRREMLHYIRPIMPGIIFAAFQGQILVFIIGIFGNTESIAEVGALSRLGQLFMIFNTMGGVLIAPYIAKQTKSKLLAKYIGIISICICLSSIIVIFVYLFPQSVLWLLGSKYAHLDNELILIIINASLGFINGIMWNMNAARKWVYNWMPLLSITGTLFLQLFFAWYLDLSHTIWVLVFSIITSLYILLNRILVSIVGFTRDKN